MMGSEVLFAQFEATSSNLKSYLSLMDTVDGASRLIRMVRGAGDQASGMAGFAESMGELQQRLAGFNQSVEIGRTQSAWWAARSASVIQAPSSFAAWALARATSPR